MSINVRIFPLLSSEENIKNLRCELFENPLQRSDKPSHSYEALSHIWFSKDKPKSILANN